MKIEIRCRMCGKKKTYDITNEQMDKYTDGYIKIQDIFPELSPDDREMFISKTCGACYDKLF